MTVGTAIALVIAAWALWALGMAVLRCWSTVISPIPASDLLRVISELVGLGVAGAIIFLFVVGGWL